MFQMPPPKLSIGWIRLLTKLSDHIPNVRSRRLEGNERVAAVLEAKPCVAWHVENRDHAAAVGPNAAPVIREAPCPG